MINHVDLDTSGITSDVLDEVEARITMAAVHYMCAYLRGEPCKGCEKRCDSPYGPGVNGCYAVAEETLIHAQRAAFS
jgi:hypothetical protein